MSEKGAHRWRWRTGNWQSPSTYDLSLRIKFSKNGRQFTIEELRSKIAG
jgi:hypothetical protein